jgi:hypothetical protein
MNYDESPEWAAAKLFICTCHAEVALALLIYGVSILTEIDPENLFVGIICLTLLTLNVAHVILCNPLFLPWCRERMRRVTPAIEQRERDLDRCSICWEQITIRNGRACTFKGGVVKLVCGHYFHHMCLDNLFVRAPHFGYNLKCPLCRRRIQIYWIDHGFYYFPGSPGDSEMTPRVVSVVNQWIFTLLQLPMLIVLIIVSINPISLLCRSVVRSFISVASLDNSFPLYYVMAAFSYLTGMELNSFPLRCVMAAITFLTGMELPATYVPLLA